MKRLVPALILALLLAASLFFTINSTTNVSAPEFYIGVEFAYSNDLNDTQGTLNSMKALVDKVEGYTNLFIIGLPEISKNQTLLTEACDYITNAGLHFIILYTDLTTYNYLPITWTTMAKQKYNGKFLGAYFSDEPGGKELDNATYRFLVPQQFDPEIRNYTYASDYYVNFLKGYFDYFDKNLYSTIFTADYGLYWFDYKGGYDTVLSEFVGNHSKQMAISLCRGAATVQNKSWGITITWTYDKEPYIESPDQLYSDMTMAYDAGAKYVVVFDYPNSTQYGILSEEHFGALKNFWNYVNGNPQRHGINKAEIAYILPENYGFGFRETNDTIWGLWAADELSPKIWGDTNSLVRQYNSSFDIVYGENQFINKIKEKYGLLFYWNETLAK